MSLLLYLTISSIWIGMVFLSAAKGYRAIVGAFFMGTVVSLTASIYLGDRLGIEGLMAGYLLGQVVILLLLVLRLLVEFAPLGTRWTGSLLKAFKTYWTLGLTGLFLNAGVWIDKMIFWWSHEGEVISGMVMSYRLVRDLHLLGLSQRGALHGLLFDQDRDRLLRKLPRVLPGHRPQTGLRPHQPAQEPHEPRLERGRPGGADHPGHRNRPDALSWPPGSSSSFIFHP
jgi:hypothetical protein